MAMSMAGSGACQLGSVKQFQGGDHVPRLWNVCRSSRSVAVRQSCVRVVAITTTRKGQSGRKRMPLKKLAISLCDRLEKQVMSWGKDEREEPPFLIENYAPVSEMAPTADLPVVGTIPACMDGEFLRVGPNPKFEPVAGYHWYYCFSRFLHILADDRRQVHRRIFMGK